MYWFWDVQQWDMLKMMKKEYRDNLEDLDTL